MVYAALCQEVVEEPTGLEIHRYHLGKFFKLAAYQLPLKICHTAAVGKTAARQLIRGIILASVVNASAWGLNYCTCPSSYCAM